MSTFVTTLSQIIKPAGRGDWSMWLGLPLFAMIGFLIVPEHWEGDPSPPWMVRGFLAFIAGLILSSRFNALTEPPTAPLIPHFKRQVSLSIMLLILVSATAIQLYAYWLWQAPLREFGLVLAVIWVSLFLFLRKQNLLVLIPFLAYNGLLVFKRSRLDLYEHQGFTFTFWTMGLLTFAAMIHFFFSKSVMAKHNQRSVHSKKPTNSFFAIGSGLLKANKRPNSSNLARLILFPPVLNLGLPTLAISSVILISLSIFPPTRTPEIVGVRLSEQCLVIGAFLLIGSVAVNDYLTHCFLTKRLQMSQLWIGFPTYHSRKQLIRGMLRATVITLGINFGAIHIPFFLWFGLVWDIPWKILFLTQVTIIFWCLPHLIYTLWVSWEKTRFFGLDPKVWIFWVTTVLFGLALKQLLRMEVSLAPAFYVFWVALTIHVAVAWRGAVALGVRIDWVFQPFNNSVLFKPKPN